MGIRAPGLIGLFYTGLRNLQNAVMLKFGNNYWKWINRSIRCWLFQVNRSEYMTRILLYSMSFIFVFYAFQFPHLQPKSLGMMWIVWSSPIEQCLLPFDSNTSASRNFTMICSELYRLLAISLPLTKWFSAYSEFNIWYEFRGSGHSESLFLGGRQVNTQHIRIYIL